MYVTVTTVLLLLLLLLPGSEPWPLIRRSGNFERRAAFPFAGEGGIWWREGAFFPPPPSVFRPVRMGKARWCLQPIERMHRPSRRWGARRSRSRRAAARASPALSGFPARLVPAWKFTAAAAECPGSLRCPDVGAGAQRGPSPGLFPPSYLCLLWDQYY